MPRPTLLLAALCAALVVASPASAQVSGGTEDPAERPADPGRDIQSVSSRYDPAGHWRIAVRFYAAPTVETSARLRVQLGGRAADGTCGSQYPNAAVSFWTSPEDRGGRASFETGSVHVVKQIDADGRGFYAEISDTRLAGRAACGL